MAVAFSGGADSTALLLAARRWWPGPVVALHVNHGLQAAAEAFEAHARALCLHWEVPLQVSRVQVELSPGDSVEEAARHARYRTLAQMAQACGAAPVFLAHHQQDQVETLLLALSRGAGLPGLAAMPEQFERHGMRFVRPWLDQSGEALRSWLVAQDIPFIDDPSNQSLRYTRNRIRHQLLPVMAKAFPAYAGTFARSARHAAQAQTLLDELAAGDLSAVGTPPVIRQLQALSTARQSNVLRFWLRQTGARQASEAQLEQALKQIAACTTRGHRIHIKVGQGFLVRRGVTLGYLPDDAPAQGGVAGGV